MFKSSLHSMENVEATGWSPRGVNFGNMRKVHLSTQLKSSDKTRWILRFLSLLVERTKENWLEEEKGRMHWLMSRKNPQMYVSERWTQLDSSLT